MTARFCAARRVLACLVLAFGITESAHAQNLKIPASLFAGGLALDATTTHNILANGGRELNPTLAVWGTPNRIVAAQIGGAAILGFTAYRLRTKHPKIAAVLLYSGAAVHLACGFWNVGVIQARPGSQPVPTFTRTF